MFGRGRIASFVGTLAVCAALVVSQAPALAQTTAPATKPSADTATVTIFAKRRPVTPAATRGGQITRIDRNSASSCSFGTNLTDVLFDGSDTPSPGADQALIAALKATIFLSNDEAAQAYFEDMGIENPNAGAQAYLGVDPLTVGGTYSDTGALGSAASGLPNATPYALGAGNDVNSKVTAKDGKAGSCTAAEAQAAASRSDIARHDTSLNQGFAALDAKDYQKALALFKKGYSKIGYPEAAYYIGQMFLAGLGTPRDTKQAIVWFKRVAEVAYDPRDRLSFNASDPYYKNSRIESDVILANIYMTGFDVPKSPKGARKWYTEAEKYGYVPASFMLGRMAQAGYGGDKNMAAAVAYYQTAGEADFAPAQYQLGQIYYNGGEGVAQDKTLAGAWLLKAAKNGYPDALYAVARMYELGEGGAQVDLPKALVYYKEAAVKGQVDAQLTLGTYLYTGEGGAPKDLDTARKLFQSAAEQGDPQAMFNLGVMMVNGEGGPKDLVKAYCWFYIADKGGIAQAGPAMRELAGKMTPDQRAQAESLLNPKAAS